MFTSRSRLLPGATPLSPLEQAEWCALSNEERLARLDALFDSPQADIYVNQSMADILTEAKARFAGRRG